MMKKVYKERLVLLSKKLQILKDLIPMENDPEQKAELLADLHQCRNDIWKTTIELKNIEVKL